MPERLRWQVGDEENGQIVQISNEVTPKPYRLIPNGPSGHEQLTVSTTAVGLSVPNNTTRALIQCGATNGVRWRADGTAPTASIGIALAADGVLDLTDPLGEFVEFLDAIQFIRSGGADATLDIEYFG